MMKSFKKNGIKMTAALLILLMSVFGLAGCGEPKNNGGSNDNGAPSVSAEEPSADQSEAQTYEVELTYVNGEYMETGDDSIIKLITDVAGSVEVPIGDGSVEEACYEAIKLLREVPKDRTDLMTSVSQDIEITGVTIDEDGKATVDLAAVPEEGMYDYTEQFFIYQIVSTLINSFEEVSGVTFTVGGQQVATIGGHLDAAVVYTLTDVDNFNMPS